DYEGCMMRAIIVAGGHGSRLFPMTLYTHKTLLPLCGRPIIDYVLSTVRSAGVENMTMNACALSEPANQAMLSRRMIDAPPS
ncbi:MAG: sugar phosphate nucleotidyltransferase, partial [Candidatus Poseidoniaceae archaeon]|nr:sugar phosphate nucleotidyltransferase [Candidatus Poseidoniaceae archaeon]